MTAETWVAIGSLLAVATSALIAALMAAWKGGREIGEIRVGVKELLARDDRAHQRMDTFDLRLNDHTNRIAKLEGSQIDGG